MSRRGCTTAGPHKAPPDEDAPPRSADFGADWSPRFVFFFLEILDDDDDDDDTPAAFLVTTDAFFDLLEGCPGGD